MDMGMGVEGEGEMGVVDGEAGELPVAAARQYRQRDRTGTGTGT
jgi:hypothetical protein